MEWWWWWWWRDAEGEQKTTRAITNVINHSFFGADSDRDSMYFHIFKPNFIHVVGFEGLFFSIRLTFSTAVPPHLNALV